MAIHNLLIDQTDYDKTRHLLSEDRILFLKKFNTLSKFATQSKHGMFSKFQKNKEIFEFLTILDSPSEYELIKMAEKWFKRAPSVEFDPPLIWLQIFGIRETAIEKIGKAIGSKEASRLVVENNVNIANGFIKMGLLDSADSLLLRMLEKRPKDYFSWELIKTITKLKLRQAEKTIIRIEDLVTMRDNYGQIALVLEKQREKFKNVLTPIMDYRFQAYIGVGFLFLKI